MDLIEKCLNIALISHRGQKDKLGKSYILHSLAVMQKVAGNGDDVMCVGLLHDVIEDTEIDGYFLRNSGVPDHIIKSVEIITRLKGEKYIDYINRIISSNNENALLVKRSDLLHNLSPLRETGIPKGKKILYEESLNKINDALKRLTA